MKEFFQTSSMVRRIQVITTALAFLLLLEFAGILLSSQELLSGLTEQNRINSISDLVMRTDANFASAQETVEKFSTAKASEKATLELVYRKAHSQTTETLNAALAHAIQFPEVAKSLDEVNVALNGLDTIANRIFNSESGMSAVELSRDLLLAKQFGLDCKDSLGRAQSILKTSGERTFSRIYGNRFAPLYTSLALSAAFFLFVLISGLRTSRRLKLSVGNLLAATDRAAKGDLSVRPVVLFHDEFGQLTAGFGEMMANLERSLENAQKAIRFRDEFLSIASHELKTPITSMKLQLQLARRQTSPEENIVPSAHRLARLLSVSTTQVDRLNALVDELLDVSRIQSGKLMLEFAQEDLVSIVRGVLENLDESLRSAGCAVDLTSSGPVFVYCDRFRVEQVVTNLLTNAMKYGAGQPVHIEVERVGNVARLRVQDEGMGIPEDKLGIIFDRFERATHSRNISGLGLGLYIARQIVSAHKGRISVESSPGKGATFVVDLPMKELAFGEVGLSPQL